MGCQQALENQTKITHAQARLFGEVEAAATATAGLHQLDNWPDTHYVKW